MRTDMVTSTLYMSKDTSKVLGVWTNMHVYILVTDRKKAANCKVTDDKS